MSTVKSKKLQVGTDATSSNNFTIYQPSTPDGTLRIGVGNADSPTEVARFDSIPSYSARAWVNFNGSGTVAIRASGNVSSVTDNGTGNYTINFTTAMPDTNYSWQGSARFNSTGEANGILSTRSNDSKTTSGLQVRSFDCAIASSVNPIDSTEINVSVFR